MRPEPRRQEGREAVAGGEDGSGISSDSEEGGMSEGNLSCISKKEAQPKGQNGINSCQDHQVMEMREDQIKGRTIKIQVEKIPLFNILPPVVEMGIGKDE